MKLYYFKSDTGNFGDDLNPWLWPQLIPELLDDTSDTLFVGIGTLLNHRIPSEFKTKKVFGSGIGYGKKPAIDNSYEFLCVRGPLTAKALGLKPSLAITDPAILVSTLGLPMPKERKGIAFMPHVDSTLNADWEQICKLNGVDYIDPRWDVDRVLKAIANTSLLISEAMHGAIIADTFRVPWVPVVCYDHILEFKWLDWCASLNLNYDPIMLPSIWDQERNLSNSAKAKNKLKRGLISLGIDSRGWTQPPKPKSSKKDLDKFCNEFAHLLTHLSPRLSEQHIFNGAVARLQEKIDFMRVRAHHLPQVA